MASNHADSLTFHKQQHFSLSNMTYIYRNPVDTYQWAAVNCVWLKSVMTDVILQHSTCSINACCCRELFDLLHIILFNCVVIISTS